MSKLRISRGKVKSDELLRKSKNRVGEGRKQEDMCKSFRVTPLKLVLQKGGKNRIVND